MSADNELRQAATDQRLWDVVRERAGAGDVDAARIAAVCERIATQTAAEADRLRAAAQTAGLEVELTPDPAGQLHVVHVTASDWSTARRFAAVARENAYVSWQDRDGGAAEAFFRTQEQLHLVRLADVPHTIALSWPAGGATRRLPTALLPSGRDFDTVALPPVAWPLYFLVRPIRLMRERLAGGDAPSLPLGPILSTPVDLLDALLEFAGLTADDHLVDLGCGDGRVLIHAVDRHGCEATGVENDPALVARAREQVRRAGLHGRVEIVDGDARSHDLSAATVVFLFIPAEHVADVAAELRDRGFDGRIVSHEQRWVRGTIEPSASEVLTGTNSLTVAHRW